MDTKKVKISQLNQSPARHETLPEELIERIKKTKELLGDVDEATLEEAIDDFKRDMNPEKEIQIWERIASVYHSYISEKNITDLAVKKEVFSVILRLSMGMELKDLPDVKLLSRDQLENIVYNYHPLRLKDIIE